MAGAKLSEQERALHQRLVRMRNKIVAHSDRELMRMTTKTFKIPHDENDEDGKGFVLIHSVFDEGITLLGDLLIDTNELLRKLYFAVYKTLSDEAQKEPGSFDMRLDYNLHQNT